MGSARTLMALALIAIMVWSTVGLGASALAASVGVGSKAVVEPAVVAPSEGAVGFEAWKAKVDPELLKPEAYEERPTLPLGEDLEWLVGEVKSSLATRLPSPTDGKARVIIYFTGGDEAVSAIKEKALVVSGARFDRGENGYLIAWVSMDELVEVAKLPYVLSIVPDKPQPLPEVRSDRLFEAEAQAGGGFEPNIYGAVDIMGATYAWSLGYNGSGVTVAVVDTGLDMGESDLGLEALAYDAYGRPLLFDADEVGLTLTLNDVTYLGNGTILIQPFAYGNASGILFYDGYDGGIYLINYTLVYVYDFYTGNYSVAGFTVAGQTYGVPDTITNASAMRFGLASQNLYVGRFFVWVLAPVLNVDYDGDGTWDGVYVDLSTTYFLFQYALYQLGYAPFPDTTLFDASFADEQLLNYSNPIAARDFTGDGVNDFSLGAIAGAFNDVNGIFGDVYSFDWLVDFEDIGYIVPGYDEWYGQWVAFEFDFHSHGTFCAHVVAGRGKVPRPLGYGEGYYNLTGVAPAAKIGGASALWNGNVLIAQLYLSGYELIDPANFTWAYTGATQADVISNSWGSSYLIINGYTSDADPSALWEDFISLTTGTIIVHAAGNGGPGYGSVTMPGTATAVITVGASTEFLYRPYYGYLPGAYYQVISWSDRGPTQLGYPKPDVVNIGSFAWSVGRVIDGLGNGVYAFDLFGGTSEATPMTAGAVAILVQALRENGYQPTPGLVKTLLKSSAKHLGYDPFTEGSGHVDLRDAIDRILEGGFIVETSAPLEVSKYFDDTMAIMLGMSKSYIQTLFAKYSDTAVYADVVRPGETRTVEMKVASLDGVTPSGLEYKVVHHEKFKTYRISQVADLGKAVLLLRTASGYQILPVPNKYVAVMGSYIFIRADLLTPGSRLLVPLKESMLTNADLVQIDAYYPYKYMDPFGRQGGYNTVFFMGVETSYWLDYNYDGLVLPTETARIQYDIREGNAFHVQIGKPAEAFQLARATAVEYLQEYYGINASDAPGAPVLDVRFFVNAWYGAGSPVVLPLKTSVTLYKEEPWDWISLTPTEDGFNVTITVPEGTKPGVYEGHIIVYNSEYETYVPVSVSVPIVVEPRKPTVLTDIGGEYLYDNYIFRGALDQGWRPETGDWRVYPVLLNNTDGRIAALSIKAIWTDSASSFDLALNGPGFNFWGVADKNYTAWIDAATVAAKISGVSRFVVVNETRAYGVYTYFDYPTQKSSEILAPVAPPLFDPDASVYWLVVHQIFQGKDPDRITLIITPLTLFSNELTLQAGTSKAKLAMFYSHNMGTAVLLGDPIIIPLAGGAGNLQVMVNPDTLPATPLKRIQLIATADENGTGVYLVMIPYLAPKPSVIWGFNAFGVQGLLYQQPTIFFITFIIYVTPPA